VITFADGKITQELLQELLGIVPLEWILEIHKAIDSCDISLAFTLSERLFHEGKDVNHFLDDLGSHFRTLLLMKLNLPVAFSDEYQQKILQKASLQLNQDQLLEILECVKEAQKALKIVSSQRLFLEGVLLNIIRINRRVPIASIVQKMCELEEKVSSFKDLSHVELKSSSSTPQKTKKSVVNEGERTESPKMATKEQEESYQEGLVQFAAVELNGVIEKKSSRVKE